MPIQPTVLVYTMRLTPARRRSFEDVAGAIDIRAVELFGMPGPEAVIGRDMEDHLAARDSPGERLGIAQVTCYALDVELTNLT